MSGIAMGAPGEARDAASDLLIAGSGVAGLVAAITARCCGLNPVIVEKSDKWGGTSAMSGGSLWIPGHHLMAENGVDEDMAEAAAYLAAHASQGGAPSSPERQAAFLQTGPEMVRFLADLGFEWDFSPFPDYYPEAEGASYGRGVNAKLFDGAALGAWRKSMRAMVRIPAVVVKPHEFKSMLMPTRDLRAMRNGLTVALRTAWWRLRGKSPMFIGQALTGRLMEIALKLGVDVRLNSAIVDLLHEGGRVVGAVVESGGVRRELRAKAGVVLASGGFARNDALRRSHQAVAGSYTVAVPEDTGDALTAAIKLGAATALMDDAWWGASVLFPDGSRSFLLWERTLPHSLIVDRTGRRYVNEAAPYNDLGRVMVERSRIYPADPSFLIMDARHRRRYVFANLLGGYNPSKLIRSGFLIKAATIDELAAKCGIDTATLKETLQRFNRFAKTGKDHDFGRGDSLFDRIYGDDAVGPNPCLGAVEQAPFWAVRIHPGDLGTKGGLLTNSDGQVLDMARLPIAGLYASGNTTASVMGRGYPGPGSTLGPAAVFAYRAARHAGGTLNADVGSEL
ncbi:FAD-dependent oxidoreductase [Novosphingobium sp. PASSN1]|uniref:FAD-dependent oxidoreductase n=1 Tax=Novosphingobium sp. PASSN1 TaxID=2015561 RepID=UPI0025E2D508|nr:FAD-dependent oxidoreductase [Novosphingobium sp. PASSN1]